MKMMQKLAPAYQRSMQYQLPERKEEGHSKFGLRSTRSQSVSNTRYFSRDPQTKLLKDNDHKQLLEQARKSSVLKVQKIPNTANIKNDRELKRATLLQQETEHKN